MPQGHSTQGGRRDAPRNGVDEREREHERGYTQQGGGRSERWSHERDREQRRAGYAPRDWERREESYRTVHSEPDWDPTRLSHDRRGFGYDVYPSEPQDSGRRAHYGYDDDAELQQRRMRAGRPHNDQNNWRESLDWGPSYRQSSPEFERDYRAHEHEQGLASEIGNAGRRLIGRIKRVVRNPKNYTRSDERIREDVCDRLALAHDVDPSELEVTVSAGEVTLTGTVSDRQMKFAAEEIADSVPGVHDVHNQLRVIRPAPPQATSNVAINSQDAGRPGKNIGRS